MFHLGSNNPVAPTSPPFVLLSDPLSPVHYILPPTYITNPPIACPDFNTLSSDDSQPPPPLGLAFSSPRQLENIINHHHTSTLARPHLPIAIYPLQALCCMPLSASHRLLPEDHSQPLPLLPLAFQPAANMAHTRAHSIAAMPSMQDRLAPYFSGKLTTQ